MLVYNYVCIYFSYIFIKDYHDYVHKYDDYKNVDHYSQRCLYGATSSGTKVRTIVTLVPAEQGR